MTWERLDTAAMSRSLAAIADRPGDLAEIFCERLAEAEWPAAGSSPGLRVRREQGLAVRLMRERRSFYASRDGITSEDLAEALKQVARAQPPSVSPPELVLGPELPVPVSTLRGFAGEVDRALRRQHVAFPLRLATRWHRRDLQVVSPRFLPAPEREEFWSWDAETPWGRCGGLATKLDVAAAERVAAALLGRFRARDAPPPAPGRRVLWLAPAAAAVLLHEAVAHALEADLLALGGRPEAAIGLELAEVPVDIFDDPRRAPTGVDRATDDEGQPVLRRWLLRAGRVDQPLADLAAAGESELLHAGSGFRGGRHEPPLPRVHHLELLSGTADESALGAASDGGLFVSEIDAGRLDPHTGAFSLHVPWGREIEGGAPRTLTGPFVIRGRVAELLRGALVIGDTAISAGAGWCSKGGRRRAVWATVPALVLTGLEHVAVAR